MTSTPIASSSPIASTPTTSTSRKTGSSSVPSWGPYGSALQPSEDGCLPSPLARSSSPSSHIVMQQAIDAHARAYPSARATPAAPLGSPIQLPSPMVVQSPPCWSENAFTENPPPYSESRYPRGEGLNGLGLSFAADLPSPAPAPSPQQTFGLPQFLTYDERSRQTIEPSSRAQIPFSEAYAQAWSARPTQDSERRVRSRLQPVAAAAAPAPAQPALASPTFAFSFTFPSAPSLAGAMQSGQTSAQPGWSMTSSATVTYQSWPNRVARPPRIVHPSVVVMASEPIAQSLAPEAIRWLGSTWQPLEQAGFTREQRHTLAQRLGPDARAKLLWNINALTNSGYTSENIVHMLVQPGANDWLSTLARVLHRLHGHGLSAAEVTTLLQAPNPNGLLCTFEPGPSRR